MMKRLLVLALVLSIATVANATLIISGPIELVPSDYVTITISGDGTDPMGGYFFGSSGPGTLSDPVMHYEGSLAAITEIPDPDLAAMLGLTNLPVYLLEWVDAPMPPDEPRPLDGDLTSFTFHCDDYGLVTLVLFDGDFIEVARLEIEQIPEPATMLLLGLGGLFLRRRK